MEMETHLVVAKEQFKVRYQATGEFASTLGSRKGQAIVRVTQEDVILWRSDVSFIVDLGCVIGALVVSFALLMILAIIGMYLMPGLETASWVDEWGGLVIGITLHTSLWVVLYACMFSFVGSRILERRESSHRVSLRSLETCEWAEQKLVLKCATGEIRLRLPTRYGDMLIEELSKLPPSVPDTGRP